VERVLKSPARLGPNLAAQPLNPNFNHRERQASGGFTVLSTSRRGAYQSWRKFLCRRSIGIPSYCKDYGDDYIRKNCADGISYWILIPITVVMVHISLSV
jgi:hypothetical protein